TCAIWPRGPAAPARPSQPRPARRACRPLRRRYQSPTRFVALRRKSLLDIARGLCRCRLGGWSSLLVLPVCDEVVDDGGVGEGLGVAEEAKSDLGDLAQGAEHDSRRARLCQ